MGGEGKSELGTMKWLFDRHMGHVRLADLSSSFPGTGAVVEERQLRMHSMYVRNKGWSVGGSLPRQKT